MGDAFKSSYAWPSSEKSSSSWVRNASLAEKSPCLKVLNSLTRSPCLCFGDFPSSRIAAAVYPSNDCSAKLAIMVFNLACHSSESLVSF